MRSEASARFERGADPEIADRAARRFVELLRLTCPDAQLHSEIDARAILPDRTPVTLRTPRVNALLGTDLPSEEIRRLLESIGFVVEPGAEPQLSSVTIPTWRYDCAVEVDLIEEVARMYGYSRIVQTVPKSPHPGGLSAIQQDRRLLRQVMVGLGVSEAMPNPFLAPGDLGRAGLDPAGISLTNPLATEESVLRTSLLPGLLKAVAYNASHRNEGVALFEIGHVYGLPKPGELLPDEREILGVALAGRGRHGGPRGSGTRSPPRSAGTRSRSRAGERQRACTRPARSCSATTATSARSARSTPPRSRPTASPVGSGGCEIELDRLFAAPRAERRYRPVSRFPSSDIDLAFIVPDTIPAGDVERDAARCGRSAAR